MCKWKLIFKQRFWKVITFTGSNVKVETEEKSNIERLMKGIECEEAHFNE